MGFDMTEVAGSTPIAATLPERALVIINNRLNNVSLTSNITIDVNASNFETRLSLTALNGAMSNFAAHQALIGALGN
jgi:hypothetical protein